jgi:hypothetical protein
MQGKVRKAHRFVFFVWRQEHKRAQHPAHSMHSRANGRRRLSARHGHTSNTTTLYTRERHSGRSSRPAIQRVAWRLTAACAEDQEPAAGPCACVCAWHGACVGELVRVPVWLLLARAVRACVRARRPVTSRSPIAAPNRPATALTTCSPLVNRSSSSPAGGARRGRSVRWMEMVAGRSEVWWGFANGAGRGRRRREGQCGGRGGGQARGAL